MVKAIQDLKKENDDLKAATAGLTDRLTKQEQMQNILTEEIEKLKTNNNEFSKVTFVK